MRRTGAIACVTNADPTGVARLVATADAAIGRTSLVSVQSFTCCHGAINRCTRFYTVPAEPAEKHARQHRRDWHRR